jgi:hypothetical protein
MPPQRVHRAAILKRRRFASNKQNLRVYKNRQLMPSLAPGRSASQAWQMFAVSEEEAAAIRAAFDRDGEFAAAIVVRRLFPAIADNEHARQCARTIAGWKPLSLPLRRRRSLRCARKAKPGRKD